MSLADRINRATRRIPAWPIYIISATWIGWLFWQALTGALGVEPINALERAYGEVALKLLVAGLCVTPLRRYAGINLLRYRRAIGLSAFMFVAAHLSVWSLLDVQALSAMWADIVKRPYVTVGMLAFLMLLPLAVTSNNASIRRLGANWRRLHWLTYPAAVLGGLHFLWLVKGFQIEPIIYLVLIGGLLALRFRFAAARRRSAA